MRTSIQKPLITVWLLSAIGLVATVGEGSVLGQTVVTAPLNLQISGNGTVWPLTNGQTLRVGNSYSVIAMPWNGYLFAGWSGGVTSSASRISFRMQTNLLLRATFVPNPFPNLNGTYYGLFSEDSEVRPESAGLFSMVLTKQGAYSGYVQIGRKRSTFSGTFDLAGSATRTVVRAGMNPLTMSFLVDVASGSRRMIGTISDGSWTADLAAVRTCKCTSPQIDFSGAGTLALFGNPDDPMVPGGDGVGLITVVNPGSRLRLTGSLADATSINQSVAISSHGEWPVYVPLYGGRGLLMGWLEFASPPDTAIRGTMTWIRPQQPRTRFYPAGFTNNVLAVGSRYARPSSGTRALEMDMGAGMIRFEGGNLAQTFANRINLTTLNKAVNQSSNRLTCTISLSQGAFSGAVTPPGQRSRLTFRGVLLQNQNFGSGYFLGTNQSGRVYFGP